MADVSMHVSICVIISTLKLHRGQKRLRTVTTKVRSKTAPYYFYVRGQKRPAVKNGGQKRLRTNSTYASAVFDRFAHFL